MHGQSPRESKNYPVIVVGTGRCGTSAVAGVLQRLGIFMGNTFVPPNDSNVRGTYEDVEFQYLDDLFLKGNCSEDAWYDTVIGLIESRMSTVGVWGWKTPTLTDLLAFYTKLLPKAHYLMVERDIEATIESCIKAYGWNKEFAKRIVLRRSESIHHYICSPKDKDAVVLNFNELITAPETVINDMLSWLGRFGVSPHASQVQAAIRSIDVAQDKGSKVKSKGTPVKIKPSSIEGSKNPAKGEGGNQTIAQSANKGGSFHN